MDKTFHEVQAKVAKRLMHSDRHRVRRTSIGPEIVTCSSKNHDLSRLLMKNEVLFKDLEGKVSSIEQEQRRTRNEFIRTEKAFSSSARKKSLPHIQYNKIGLPTHKRKLPFLTTQPRRSSLINDELPATSTTQLVQNWLQSFYVKDGRNNKNVLDIPPFLDHNRISERVANSKELGQSNLESEFEPSLVLTSIEET